MELRVRLPATKIGWRWMVKPADLDEFFKRLSADPSTDPAPQTGRAETARERAAARAEKKLLAAGC